jgi:hypothetical protein
MDRDEMSKHGRHRQFLFLISRFLKIFSSENALPNKELPVTAMFGNGSGRNEQSL